MTTELLKQALDALERLENVHGPWSQNFMPNSKTVGYQAKTVMTAIGTHLASPPDAFASVGKPIAAHPTPKPDQWLPIETAPKDGTEILAILKGQIGAQVIFYDFGEWLTSWDEFRLLGDDTPTHWMPLPLPPPIIQPTTL